MRLMIARLMTRGGEEVRTLHPEDELEFEAFSPDPNNNKNVKSRPGFVFTTGRRGTGYYADKSEYSPYAVHAVVADTPLDDDEEQVSSVAEGKPVGDAKKIETEEAKVDSWIEGIAATAEPVVRAFLRAFFRMHVQSHNIAHYTGDYSTKFAEQTGSLLPAIAGGIERYESGCGSIQPRPREASSEAGEGAPVDSYAHKHSASTAKCTRKRESWDAVLQRGYSLLIRLQTSANRTIVKKLTEMNFQLRYGHEAYLSHRTWTLFAKRPILLAYRAMERRKRKDKGEDYENLAGYEAPLGKGVNDDEEAGATHEDFAQDQCVLRASSDRVADAEELEEEHAAADGEKIKKKHEDRDEEQDGDECPYEVFDAAAGEECAADDDPDADKRQARETPEASVPEAGDVPEPDEDSLPQGCRVGLGRVSRQFDNWLLRGVCEPLLSMGLYHYTSFVFEKYCPAPYADFATYVYDPLHSSCSKCVQKLRVDEAFCVPRLCGIGFDPVPTSVEERNRAALQKLMLFKPLRLPFGASKYMMKQP